MPDWEHYVRERLAPLQLGVERELDMVDEMAQHLEAVYEDCLSDGASEQEAFQRAAAHIKDWSLLECELIRAKRPIAGAWVNNRLAREARIKSETRAGGMIMGSLLQDLRYAIRMLRKSKGFTAVAVLSLALGIGANTALFSLIDAVLLKTLPVTKPSELVLFNWLSGPRGMARSIDGSITTDPASGMRSSTSFSYLTFERIRDHNDTLSGVFAFAPVEQLNVNVDGIAEVAEGQLVTGGYYDALGVRPILGSTIAAGDDNLSAEPVTVITHRYWERRFARDPEIIGKKIDVNNVRFTIIGVTPPEFFGTLQVGESPDLTIPMSLESLLRPKSQSLRQPWFWWVRIMGRLKPGVAPEQARVDSEALFQNSAQEGSEAALAQFPQARAQGTQPRDVPSLRAAPGSQGLNELRSAYSQPLTILLIVVGAVLLIACANVANLQLSRAATRQREIAIRLAMGASRWRLVRQLLTESVLLAMMGGTVGVILAYWGKDVLLALRPWGGDALALELKLDLRVLAFTIVASLITGILFGLAPAVRATRVDLTPALKESARALAGGSRSLLTKSLIVVQVAMSLVLIIGAGLFVNTLRNLQAVDAGFNRENLLLFRIDPRLSGYTTPQIPSLYQRLTERIEAVPGVRSAALSRHPLLSGSARNSNIQLQGSDQITAEVVYFNPVSASFFETMEIPILLGRGLNANDDQRAPKVAVINQAMVRRYFGEENPIGQRFGFGESGETDKDKFEIVGVARDAKYTSLRRETPPTAYTSYLQENSGQMNFEVRTAGDVSVILPGIREAVREVDGNLPMFSVKTQRSQSDDSVREERLFATLSSFFGVLALLLACIGLYGVMSYGVARRTNEIGIRMALGATATGVTRMVMFETAVVVLIGIAIGLGTALTTTRLIAKMLFGLTPNDPATILLAILLMAGVAAVAGYLPARRAAKVDPMVALRYE